MTLKGQIQISVEMYCFACKIQTCYISTDEVERYCYRSRNQYFMVTKLRNYSTTAEATMTKFKLSSKAIYLGGNPKKMNFLVVQVTEIFDLNGKPQKG